MEILTQYGSIDYEDLDDYELSEETKAFIDRQKDAAEIFFAEEIDLTEIDVAFIDSIRELAEVAIAENKYTEPERAFAIAEYTDTELTDVDEEENDSSSFVVGGGDTYLVLTEEEADKTAIDYARNLIDDIGIDNLSNGTKDVIYSEYVKTDWYDEAMEEYNQSYADDIKTEASSDDDLYVNRLHEEMVEKGVMEEPEWPEESEFEVEDADGDMEIDDDAYEDAKSDFRTDLEGEVENNIDDFVEQMGADYENGLEYYKDHFGEEETARIAVENDLVDKDAVAEYIVDQDGRGQSISSYDGGEDSINITFKGEEFEFLIYRMD